MLLIPKVYFDIDDDLLYASIHKKVRCIITFDILRTDRKIRIRLLSKKPVRDM